MGDNCYLLLMISTTTTMTVTISITTTAPVTPPIKPARVFEDWDAASKIKNRYPNFKFERLHRHIDVLRSGVSGLISFFLFEKFCSSNIKMYRLLMTLSFIASRISCITATWLQHQVAQFRFFFIIFMYLLRELLSIF